MPKRHTRACIRLKLVWIKERVRGKLFELSCGIETNQFPANIAEKNKKEGWSNQPPNHTLTLPSPIIKAMILLAFRAATGPPERQRKSVSNSTNAPVLATSSF